MGGCGLGSGDGWVWAGSGLQLCLGDRRIHVTGGCR